MKSRIQWKRSSGDLDNPKTHYAGKVENCDFYINIYTSPHAWHWTIRSQTYSQNLVVCNKYYKTLKAAKADAVRWTLVQLLIRIDPKILRGINNEHYTIPWFESFNIFLNGRSIPHFNPFQPTYNRMGKGYTRKPDLCECFYTKNEEQPSTINLRDPLQPGDVITAGNRSGTK